MKFLENDQREKLKNLNSPEVRNKRMLSLLVTLRDIRLK